MRAIGDRRWVFTAGSVTDSVTSVTGYEGGRWNNGRFFYNRAVNNINVTNIHNVYNVRGQRDDRQSCQLQRR